jgi:hypothetical protein
MDNHPDHDSQLWIGLATSPGGLIVGLSESGALP